MRRYFVAILLSLVAASAFAFDSYRMGNRIIRVGDPIARLEDVMGQPDSTEDYVNKFGAKLGTFWYFTDAGKTIRVLVVQGAIAQIQEIHS